VLCTDGETGGEAQARAGLRTQSHFITRLADYDALRQETVLDALSKMKWEQVNDSKSGPTRWATEYGTRRWEEGLARLVVTKFKSRNGSRHGAGILIDGWQYEVFATSLPPDAFPAPEITTAYYARAGI